MPSQDREGIGEDPAQGPQARERVSGCLEQCEVGGLWASAGHHRRVLVREDPRGHPLLHEP